MAKTTVYTCVCAVCKEKFETLCRTAKYCSGKCRSQALRERQAKVVSLQAKKPALEATVKDLVQKNLSYAEMQMQESLRMLQEQKKTAEPKKAKEKNWWGN